jgi:hypothetical protein
LSVFSLYLVSEKVEDEHSNVQVTSQMLFVCCWRTIEEISLLFSRLGQVGIEYIKNKNEYRFINLKQLFSFDFISKKKRLFPFRLMLYVIILWNNY